MRQLRVAVLIVLTITTLVQAQGFTVGTVTDCFGRTLEEIRAPFAGEMLYVVGTPAIDEGEPIGSVGQVKP